MFPDCSEIGLRTADRLSINHNSQNNSDKLLRRGNNIDTKNNSNIVRARVVNIQNLLNLVKIVMVAMRCMPYFTLSNLYRRKIHKLSQQNLFFETVKGSWLVSSAWIKKTNHLFHKVTFFSSLTN